jgi:hypothetical protein
MASFDECSTKIEAIDRAILQLEQDLRAELRKTFE